MHPRTPLTNRHAPHITHNPKNPQYHPLWLRVAPGPSLITQAYPQLFILRSGRISDASNVGPTPKNLT